MTDENVVTDPDPEYVGATLRRFAPEGVWKAVTEWYRCELPPCLATDEELEQTERALLLRLQAAVERAMKEINCPEGAAQVMTSEDVTTGRGALRIESAGRDARTGLRMATTAAAPSSSRAGIGLRRGEWN